MADVLVVDDDPDIREPLVEFLRAIGHDVRVAEDGEAALRLLGEPLPDLVLLDIEMPVLDGPATAHRMFLDDIGRERVPIVFVSGVPEIRQLAERVGTAYYLQKPFTLSALSQLVTRALAERAPPTYPEFRRADPSDGS